ncbi:MAG: hypothetical protein AAB692_01885 [Patescibacteria group bacterium]
MRSLSIFARTAIVLILAEGCAHGATEAARSTVVPLWTLSQAPDGKQPEHTEAATLAVKVADHYLLTTMVGMPLEVRYFLAEPAVFVSDGEKWYRGRYVDYRVYDGLALVRTEEILPGSAAEIQTLRSGGELREVMLVGNRLGERTAAVMTSRPRNTRGSIFFDDQGKLCGVRGGYVEDRRAIDARGPEILHFLRTYFAAGGREVEPKPAFVENAKPPPDGGGSVPH